MAVFVSVQTDPFREIRSSAQSRQPQINVRRPLRGIQVKKDTYAVMRVKTASGADLPLFDSSSSNHGDDGIGTSTHYSNFLIQSVSDTRVEKQQIVETFGEDYVYFFGERPRFIEVQGLLLNTADFNWKNEFWENYERFLRGTRLVEQNARVYLYFDDVVVEGYFVSAAGNLQSTNPNAMPFQFTFYVSNYATLSRVGSVFIDHSDNQNGVEMKAVYPPDAADRRAMVNAATGGNSGLSGFLAKAATFADDASFAIQSALEVARNTLYARRLVVPDGLGSQIVVPDIDNLASYKPAPNGRPIHEMSDEYVERNAGDPAYDKAELARVEAALALQTPEQLELKARMELRKRGVNVDKPNPALMLLGRGAFAAVSYVAPFGLAKADGKLGVVDQGVSMIL